MYTVVVNNLLRIDFFWKKDDRMMNTEWLYHYVNIILLTGVVSQLTKLQIIYFL